ncbi:hypothetical protein CE91St64_25550 [Faecalicatena contorta]|nr:hypothetical protein CE91St64_25550 [Faecalicatena contorta]
MNNFQYYTPTKVVFGRGAEEETGNLIQAYGCTKVLVHYGSGSVKRTGLLERICRSLSRRLGSHILCWEASYPTHTYPLYMKGSNCAKRKGLTLFWP